VTRKDPQLNVRLPPEREAILRAAAFVNGNATPVELAREILETAIEGYAQLPTVKKALEARTEQAAANEGKLTHLRQGRERSAAPGTSKRSK
jgi:hypothetical protein